MKAPQLLVSSQSRSIGLVPLLALAFVPALTPLARADTPASAPKDHILFVGLNLAVKDNGKYVPVVGATNRALEFVANHQLKQVALRDAGDIRISRGVKLSALTATIGNMRTDSVNRAAARAQLDAMHGAMAMMDEAAMSRDRAVAEMTNADLQGGSNQPDPRDAANRTEPAATSAMRDIANMLPGADANIANASSFMIDDMAPNPALGEVELSFEVSAPRPLEQAYLVVIADYASTTDPKDIARQVTARALGQIDTKPRKVWMLHPAVIAGREFKKFYLGVYAEGQEVATNLSEKRLELTRDQAYQFFLIDYLAAHRSDTRPPSAMLMVSRAEFRHQVGGARLDQPVYARVDKTGALVALSADEAGTEKIPASIDTALQQVRFVPALDKGQPVDGRARLTLAALVE